MSDTRGMRLRLGAFVLVALVLLGTMIVMFGSLPGFFKSTTPYVVRFTDAPGLAPGAPVRRSGVRIGEVRAITLDEERGIVRVSLRIDSPYRLRKSEQATLVVGILGGDASIDLVPKQPVDGEPVDRDPFESGAELVGVRAATVNTLLRGAGDVLPSTQETLADIRKSIQRLEKFVARAEKTIPLAEETLREYRELAKSARGTVPEVQKAVAEIRELAKAYREVAPEATRAIEEYRQLGSDIRRAIPDILKTNREIQETVRSARELFPTAEAAVEEFRELVRDARKLVPTVRSNIEDIGATARQMQKLAENLDRVVLENKDEIKKAIDRLSGTLEQALKILSDDNIRKFNSTLANVASASEPLPAITKNLDDVMLQARTTVRQLNETLKKVDDSLKDVGKLTRPLGERSAAISRNADEALSKLNGILGDVQSLMRALDKSNGTLRKLIEDPSIYNNIDRALIAAVKLVPYVERILKDAEVFMDKLARHPELLGVRGAITPDRAGGTGLKGPPTPPIVPRK